MQFNLVTARTPEITETQPRGKSSRLLQLTRRLDWRFLLPDPKLGKVAYAGPPGELLSALQMYSDSVTLLSADSFGPIYPRFDMVVLQYPSRSTLESACMCVKPGGNLYVELLGALGSASYKTVAPTLLSGLMKYVRTLWAHEFAEVQAYWHRPGFEHCLEIVPLFDRVAMRFALSRERPAGFSREVKMIASLFLMRMGLLSRFVPCYSLLAEKRK